jgi:hypothetical protein
MEFLPKACLDSWGGVGEVDEVKVCRGASIWAAATLVGSDLVAMGRKEREGKEGRKGRGQLCCGRRRRKEAHSMSLLYILFCCWVLAMVEAGERVWRRWERSWEGWREMRKEVCS